MGSDGDNDSRILDAWAKTAETTAGSNEDRPTLWQALGTITAKDFTNIHNTPCARNGLLIGISSGFIAGSLCFITRGKLVSATNWAVGVFIGGSVVSFEYCQYQRYAERTRMKRAVETLAELRREDKEKARQKAEEKKRLEEERKAAQKPWYKVW
ncbi:hypothetical protein CDD81_6600 [Ophiocordyceps australis]|uniref:Cytochrome c oxidase assembly protein COX20, mitochondrial n=1 Tax=Ophiocordyceps australis TaxID=1399860 RepID=A0A2C5Y6M3_9HYPO|nr:hypothetical protein CDD81_6600 [Ophiocordyceps australis]